MRLTVLTAVLGIVGLPLTAQRFVEAERSALPRECSEMQTVWVVELTGDGVPDLVVSDTRFASGTNRPVVLRGDGRGAWTTIRRSYNGIAVGVDDLDGDGDRDIVTATGVEANQGGGNFATVPWNVPAAWPCPAVVGDFTGDGRPDVLFLTPLRFLTNLGGMVFVDQTAQRAPGGGSWESGCAFDADGDGAVDVFAAGASGHVLLRNQAGVLVPALPTALPPFTAWPRACVACDCDGDGDQDLVLGGPTARLWRNAGGTFVDVSALLGAPVADVLGVAAGDVDGDGDVDLLLGQRTGGLLLRQQGGGYVADPAACDARGQCISAPVLADLDGDGDLDLVLGKREPQGATFLSLGNGFEPTVAWNDGSGTFHDPARNDLPRWSGLGFAAVGDVDGDGAPDLVVADGAGTTLRNRGDGTFDAVPLTLPASGRVALGDLNGDPLPDLVLLATDGRFWSFTNVGGGQFNPRSGPHQVPLSAAQATGLALGDLNGDGRLDVFVATGIAGFSPFPIADFDAVWLGQAGGFVLATAWCTQATDLDDVALGDVDGDGDLDVVSPGLLLRNQGGTFAYVAFPRLSGVATVALGDLDGDGDLDLVTGAHCAMCGGGYDNPVNYRNDNDGSGAFGPPVVIPGTDYRGTTAVAIADLDGDGDRDILFGNDTNQHPEDQWVRNLGGGQWSLATDEFSFEADDTRQLLVADVDLDGDLDVIALNASRDATGTPRCKVFVNRMRQLVAPYAPRLGRQFVLQAHGAPGGAVVWVALRPTLQPLPPYGVLGLEPASASPFAVLPAPGAGTTAELGFPLPNQPALAGLFVAIQGIDLAAMRLSNPLHETLVAW